MLLILEHLKFEPSREYLDHINRENDMYIIVIIIILESLLTLWVTHAQASLERLLKKTIPVVETSSH